MSNGPHIPQFDRELFQRAERLADWKNDGKVRDALQAYLLAHGLLAQNDPRDSVSDRHRWMLLAREAESRIVQFVAQRTQRFLSASLVQNP